MDWTCILGVGWPSFFVSFDMSVFGVMVPEESTHHVSKDQENKSQVLNKVHPYGSGNESLP